MNEILMHMNWLALVVSFLLAFALGWLWYSPMLFGNTWAEGVGISLEDHERSHRSETFQPLFRDVLALCENGNEEIAYEMLWSGRAYNPDEAQRAREAKEKYAA